MYYFFNKWSKDDRNIWVHLLNRNKRLLEMSCVQLDGSQTRCSMGGESTGVSKQEIRKNQILPHDSIVWYLAFIFLYFRKFKKYRRIKFTSGEIKDFQQNFRVLLLRKVYYLN